MDNPSDKNWSHAINNILSNIEEDLDREEALQPLVLQGLHQISEEVNKRHREANGARIAFRSLRLVSSVTMVGSFIVAIAIPPAAPIAMAASIGSLIAAILFSIADILTEVIEMILNNKNLKNELSDYLQLDKLISENFKRVHERFSESEWHIHYKEVVACFGNYMLFATTDIVGITTSIGSFIGNILLFLFRVVKEVTQDAGTNAIRIASLIIPRLAAHIVGGVMGGIGIAFDVASIIQTSSDLKEDQSLLSKEIRLLIPTIEFIYSYRRKILAIFRALINRQPIDSNFVGEYTVDVIKLEREFTWRGSQCLYTLKITQFPQNGNGKQMREIIKTYKEFVNFHNSLMDLKMDELLNLPLSLSSGKVFKNAITMQSDGYKTQRQHAMQFHLMFLVWLATKEGKERLDTKLKDFFGITPL